MQLARFFLSLLLLLSTAWDPGLGKGQEFKLIGPDITLDLRKFVTQHLAGEGEISQLWQ